MTTLRTTQHADGTWWIAGLPAYQVDGETCTECGPYDTRREADSDRHGLQRFYRDNPEYATVGDTEARDAQATVAAGDTQAKLF